MIIWRTRGKACELHHANVRRKDKAGRGQRLLTRGDQHLMHCESTTTQARHIRVKKRSIVKEGHMSGGDPKKQVQTIPGRVATCSATRQQRTASSVPLCSLQRRTHQATPPDSGKEREREREPVAATAGDGLSSDVPSATPHCAPLMATESHDVSPCPSEPLNRTRTFPWAHASTTSAA
jgi:hypothetical protein